MNYSIIVSPKTNKSVLINSSLGKNILKKYLKALIGGAAVMDVALKEGFSLENEGNQTGAAKKFIEVLAHPNGMSLSKDKKNRENSQLLNMLIDTWPKYEQIVTEYMEKNRITNEEAKRDHGDNWLNLMIKERMLDEITYILDRYMPKNIIIKENINNEITILPKEKKN